MRSNVTVMENCAENNRGKLELWTYTPTRTSLHPHPVNATCLKIETSTAPSKYFVEIVLNQRIRWIPEYIVGFRYTLGHILHTRTDLFFHRFLPSIFAASMSRDIFFMWHLFPSKFSVHLRDSEKAQFTVMQFSKQILLYSILWSD